MTIIASVPRRQGLVFNFKPIGDRVTLGGGISSCGRDRGGG